MTRYTIITTIITVITITTTIIIIIIIIIVGFRNRVIGTITGVGEWGIRGNVVHFPQGEIKFNFLQNFQIGCRAHSLLSVGTVCLYFRVVHRALSITIHQSG